MHIWMKNNLLKLVIYLTYTCMMTNQDSNDLKFSFVSVPTSFPRAAGSDCIQAVKMLNCCLALYPLS